MDNYLDATRGLRAWDEDAAARRRCAAVGLQKIVRGYLGRCWLCRKELALAAERGDVEGVAEACDILCPTRYGWLGRAAVRHLGDTVPFHRGRDGTCTALFLAARRGHAAVVVDLCERGAPPNAGVLPEYPGLTPLHGALSGGHRACTVALLAYGADPTLYRGGVTPLMYAIEQSTCPIRTAARALLEEADRRGAKEAVLNAVCRVKSFGWLSPSYPTVDGKRATPLDYALAQESPRAQSLATFLRAHGGLRARDIQKKRPKNARKVV